MTDAPTEIPLTGGGRTAVSRIGDVVHRQTGPWAASVHALLRHLEAEGFAGAPRVIGSGFDDQGRETISFIHGVSLHPGPWPDEAMFNLGKMLADFHRASMSFVPPADAIWRPWFGRDLGTGKRIIGHGDLGDWNIIASDHQPVGFIDWEQAGPVDPLVELAQLCWLNAHLFDDNLEASIGLPPLASRARKLRYIIDGYGLAAPDRARLVPVMIELATHDAANEAVEAAHNPDSTNPADALAAVAWRVRSAAWMGRNRGALEAVLV